MLSLVIAAALAADAQGGPAIGATEQADVRCLAAFSYLAGTGEESPEKNGFITGILYFTGKLYGRNPAYDLTAGLTTTLVALGEDGLKAELPRCAHELDAVGANLDAAGKALNAPPAAGH